jgi:hypothetical protein
MKSVRDEIQRIAAKQAISTSKKKKCLHLERRVCLALPIFGMYLSAGVWR